MDCVNCGHENPEKALICYWCGLDPETGETPYKALIGPPVSPQDASAVAAAALPPPIEVPPLAAVFGVQVGESVTAPFDLTIPEPPPIEISPSPGIPSESQFRAVRHRARYRPIIRAAPTRPPATHSVLRGWGRLLVIVGGLGMLLILGLALIAALAAASFGSIFCLFGLLASGAIIWIGLLALRTGKRIVEATGATYERLEVLGQILREVAPGMIQERPVNLPRKMGVLDLPVAYSELRSLAGQESEAPTELATEMLTGAIASLVGRDDAVLARRTYPVETRGRLARPATAEVDRPVLTRRRLYVGPGELEGRVAGILQADEPMTIGELLNALLAPEGRQRAQQVIAAVNEAVSERPPNLDALTSPEDALAEFERYRTALRRADPELYEMVESEIRRRLAAVARRPIPSSLAKVLSTATPSDSTHL